jgi:hypothetical protein
VEHSLNIVWGRLEPDEIIIAQLDDCNWYFEDQSLDTATLLELTYLDRTLAENELKFPASLRLKLGNAIKQTDSQVIIDT